MNRCGPRTSPISFAVRRVLLAAAVLAAATAHAQTQIRPFPDTALRGRLQVVAPPQVRIDGRDAQLAPGARIRDARNLFVLSGSLVGQEHVVNYVPDPATGMVGDVWLLTAEEAALRRPGAEQPSWLGRLFGL